MLGIQKVDAITFTVVVMQVETPESSFRKSLSLVLVRNIFLTTIAQNTLSACRRYIMLTGSPNRHQALDCVNRNIASKEIYTIISIMDFTHLCNSA